MADVYPRRDPRYGLVRAEGSQMIRKLIAVSVLVVFVAGCADDDGGTSSATLGFAERAQLDAPGRALVEHGGALFAATGTGIFISGDDGETWQPVGAAGLPSGPVIALASAPPALLAQVWGEGMYRSTDAGASWTPTATTLESPLLSALNPRGQVIPFDFAADETVEGRLFAAAVGGLYRSDDSGATWERLAPETRPGVFNVLFTGVAARGNRVVAASIDPVSLTPAAFKGVLQGGVFASDDGGDTWTDITADIPAAVFADVALDDTGAAYVAALDGGVFRLDHDTWTSTGGPRMRCASPSTTPRSTSVRRAAVFGDSPTVSGRRPARRPSPV